MKKICTKCNEEKSIEDFYKRTNGGLHGRHAQCKSCTRKESAKWTKTHPEQKHKSQLAYQKRRRDIRKMKIEIAKASGKQTVDAEKLDEANYRYEREIKLRCRRFLNTVVAQGYMIKPESCQKCGEGDTVIHGHHKNYSKPLDVMWVCGCCHWKMHKGQKKRKKNTNVKEDT